MPDVFEYRRGGGPILVSFPHDGTDFPARSKRELNVNGLKNTDCDWHIFELYNRVLGREISFIRAKFSRYVVDLNRSPDGRLLYPGKMETGICPLTSFDGNPIYLPGKQPDEQRMRNRIRTYWQPYHNHIQAELNRIKNRHGHAVLWEAHSIRGEVPQLFEGVLPDLNFGTAGGHSCREAIIDPIVKYAGSAANYSVVLNGRFKGGYITRHYGDPDNGIHAIQLEINQNNYLEDPEAPKIDHKKKATAVPVVTLPASITRNVVMTFSHHSCERTPPVPHTRPSRHSRERGNPVDNVFLFLLFSNKSQ